MPAPVAGDTLVAAALKVMLEPDPFLKAAHTKEAAALWHSGAITKVSEGQLQPSQIPDRPARQTDKVRLVAPGAMPKLGKGGTLASRQAILHSLVHIELAAVDLSWDIIVRFGTDPSYQLPKAFFDDFVQVAADEASHFSLLSQRLEAVGSHYGALPAHDGLWESAQTTAHSLPARLAVEHCVHEARGLDVLPSTVQKFRGNGDEDSAALLQDVIYAEEMSHCAAGVRWLRHLHVLAHSWHQHQQQHQVPEGQQQRQQLPEGASAVSSAEGGSAGADSSSSSSVPEWVADALQYSCVEAWFHALIQAHFKGNLKPPFNEEARARAGFGPDWYLPLAAAGPAHKPSAQTTATANGTAAEPNVSASPPPGAAPAAAAQ